MSKPAKFGQNTNGTNGAKGVPGGVPSNWNDAARSTKVGRAQFEACRAKLGDAELLPEATPPSVKL